jgi:hypothetical protein
MNGPHTKAYVKDNRFTQLIDRVAQINAENGQPAGRAASQAAENFVSAIPAGLVRSMRPAEADRMSFRPPPMSPEEREMANAQAQALGIVESDDMPMPDRGPADGPSEEEIEAMLPSRFRTDPATQPRGSSPQPVGGMRGTELPSGVPFQAAATVHGMAAARAMPNFRNVEGFNLLRGVVVVDGMEFPLPEVDIQDMKKYALQIVLDAMVIQVAQALIEFGVPKEMAEVAAEKLRETAAANAIPPGGLSGSGKGTEPTKQEVSEMSTSETTEPVQSGGEPLSGVSKNDLVDLLGDDGVESSSDTK